MINVTHEQMLNQQQVLAALGFYKGQIDGIWSEETIKAKQTFEFARNFTPALPNNGLPFDVTQKLPRGLIRKGSSIWCPELDTYLKENSGENSNKKQSAVANGSASDAAPAKEAVAEQQVEG